jgi:orotidine-5'-phosphate decarboxylase
MTAQQKLKKKIDQGLHICVGLDTDIEKLPRQFLNEKEPILAFNKTIIENTGLTAAAYKINFAFYEKLGSKGFDLISKTLEFIPDDILTIADAKRGDIGNTSEMYAKAIFNEFKFDSVTLHPYMGLDSLQPFLQYKEKIHFVLVLTSNKGALDFENQLLSDGKYLYQRVIDKVNEWNVNENCGIVFGATKIDYLKENIHSFKNLYTLLPGVGAQGGSLEEVVEVFNNAENANYLVNISRALLYCDDSPNFPAVISEQMKSYNQSVLKKNK